MKGECLNRHKMHIGGRGREVCTLAVKINIQAESRESICIGGVYVYTKAHKVYSCVE